MSAVTRRQALGLLATVAVVPPTAPPVADPFAPEVAGLAERLARVLPLLSDDRRDLLIGIVDSAIAISEDRAGIGAACRPVLRVGGTGG